MLVNKQNGNESPTELIFGKEPELVNTNDAVVKRIRYEKAAHDRAVARAQAQHEKLIASYDAVFSYRAGQILADVEVDLPTLPPQFQENAE